MQKANKQKMGLKEFFGFGGYSRLAEGYLSFEHLLFVSILTLAMFILSFVIGKTNKNKDYKTKNKVLIVTAILIDALELFKIVILCFRSKNAMEWVYILPLFLCSIQLIAIPLAAFSKGRIKEACLDFVVIFGLLGAIMGTYCAGNNYAVYPVISLDNVVSGLTHTIAGFASLYILISKMASMKRKNIPLTCIILGGFCIAAFIANIFTNSNYMFLLRGDGTPYDIIYNLVGGNKIIYPALVILLFVIYIICYYLIYYSITKPKKQPKEKELTTV